jgi:hypothetical protein
MVFLYCKVPSPENDGEEKNDAAQRGEETIQEIKEIKRKYDDAFFGNIKES